MPSRSSGRAALLALMLAISGCGFYGVASVNGDIGRGAVASALNQANLVSKRFEGQQLTEQQKDTPVVVAVHGFSATTFETLYSTGTTPQEASASYNLENRGLLVSRVLMGGHNESSEAFGNSTWLDWQKPVLEEAEALQKLGFRHIDFLTVSTGGPILMQALLADKLAARGVTPRRITMVAPLLEFKDKTINLLGVLQTLGASNSPSPTNGVSRGHWYADRPIGAVKQLLDLTEVVKGQLRGVVAGHIRPLAPGTKVLIVQSDGDGTVDATSADIWLKGLRGPAAAATQASGLVTQLKVVSGRHVPVGPPNLKGERGGKRVVDGVDYPTFEDVPDGQSWSDDEVRLRVRLIRQIGDFHVAR
ncbi:MAG: hypothetical protein VKO21_04475 [Candidatus Sericytochromatia bacterium]|nr:hypothetical protein [Candidatus Sericytochromatia bacterium]